MNDTIIQTIDAQIVLLQQARAVLLGTNIKRGSGRPRTTATPASDVSPKQPRKRKMSAEARARIGDAQRARWAKLKKKAAK